MASPKNFIQLQTIEEFDKIIASNQKELIVVFFSASWSEECQQMKDVVIELAKDLIHSKFVQIEAEDLPELSEKYDIAFVPVFVLMKGRKEIARVEGANAPNLTKVIQYHATSFVAPVFTEGSEQKTEDLNTRLKNLINSAPCILFMKGAPSEPRCGFSRQIVDILSKYNIKYCHFDILSDDEVRQGLKTYSNWPTYPQLYANGDLIGGLDIVRELAENGELEQLLPKSEDLNTRLGKLIHKAPIMLFMKGDPSDPQCKFSRAVIQILNTVDVKYDHFDILSDNEVREGLKKYSNWPTYPQLYVNGELIGGLDIIKTDFNDFEIEFNDFRQKTAFPNRRYCRVAPHCRELQESGDLEATLQV